ncbi:hypothetical protein LTR84_000814 [Exophiala bonariae]|uniref:Carboxylesterase type B domain-containing protein n=1 Tax=Exophiala bonariae TaxID=1690606 RepID=A0AAV9NRN2_9EURO|nr:hypothetical protein LTR84_000814 [Exophiala bonariae]
MRPLFLHLGLLLSSTTIAAPLTGCPRDPKPIDLGYTRHQVAYQNLTNSGYLINVYKNIRFAEPAERFHRPAFPPLWDEPGVVRSGNYSQDTQCVSAVPQGAEALFPGLNGTVFGNEDCLFLDVYVPDVLSCQKSTSALHSAGVPVLHWLHGSAYTFGSKELGFTPLGLFDQLLSQGTPFILVVSNYRMGLYGWASSPSDETTQPNVGLYDGLAALKWSERYIHHFGGDPSRLTAGGQSTGAAMVELLSASPDSVDLPFQHAFLSSPALSLKANVTERRQDVFDSILSAANCSSLVCLLDMNEGALREINRYLINDTPSLSGGGNLGPGIGFGPIVDEFLVPELPIANPTLDKSLSRLRSMIVANMANEGAITSSDRDMPEAFPELVRRILPSSTNEIISTIQSLYQWPDAAPEQLAWQWTADAVFACHSLALAKAANTSTRRYIMSIPPAYHGLDLFYYFFTDEETTPVKDVGIAQSLQTLLWKFLYQVEPLEIDSGAEWPFYGTGSFLNITAAGLEVEQLDDKESRRCDIINRIMADPENGI